jgi:hypothetical protein
MLKGLFPTRLIVPEVSCDFSRLISQGLAGVPLTSTAAFKRLFEEIRVILVLPQYGNLFLVGSKFITVRIGD